ncbi:filamentous hemagglutinin N-terminal domain-containing protein [filamentous cyanobacterium LEGE 11480]|uniref:Filamentous hemagglutinin N-terminal domain-containing protein n=1 Tax=Romeriopsis navalis LEGE 11480 TaxID=2777977 RepID=A0A928VQU5_9CYAN|nr:filamentous hemagglutinin N-terminal domain-containing protein [Romeriopsis navalis]MBE9032067.1 filamentous hemagglutinin N-terminal domain-containing protein [Romeriopsis navalis LEGE 11480]
MKSFVCLLLSGCSLLLAAQPGRTQAIVGQELTTVTPAGNQFDITGGIPVGTNLFHSFERFGLNNSQTANFQVGGGINNVFARVTGGTTSVLNGNLQISNGITNPNLYFINPAGIVFGQNFNLNIPASFTATTANGIAFGNQWMSATATNNYALLLNEPTAFGFTMDQPAAIINANDNLSTGANNGQNLTLLGGTVVSSGKLQADPGTGKLTVAAVPGRRVVRITSTDSLLGIEIQPFAAGDSQPSDVTVPVPSLAQLITGPNPDGGTVGDATGLTLNPNGSLSLTGAGMSIQSGDVQTAALEAGGVLVSAPTGNVTVATIAASDLGVDVTAGEFFKATGTLALSRYSSMFQELLSDPNSDLLAFLQLQTGLSEADLISKYPGFATIPQAIFPTVASIDVRQGFGPGDGNVTIRYGGNSQLNFQGRAGITSTGNAPFSVGGQVSLDSPDLANRYSFENPATTFTDLANSSSGGAIESESDTFNLRRNQSATTVPIPENSSGTVGGILQLVRTDGGLTLSFGDQVFGTLPTNPTTPTPTTPKPLTPTTPPTTPVPDGNALANTQQTTDRTPQACQTNQTQIAQAQPASGTRSASVISSNSCSASPADDRAILQILE